MEVKGQLWVQSLRALHPWFETTLLLGLELGLPSRPDQLVYTFLGIHLVSCFMYSHVQACLPCVPLALCSMCMCGSAGMHTLCLPLSVVCVCVHLLGTMEAGGGCLGVFSHISILVPVTGPH